MPVINVRFSKSVLADLEGMAKDMDCSRGEVIRKLVDYALDNLGDEDETEDKTEAEEEDDSEEEGLEAPVPKRRRKRHRGLLG